MSATRRSPLATRTAISPSVLASDPGNRAVEARPRRRAARSPRPSAPTSARARGAGSGTPRSGCGPRRRRRPSADRAARHSERPRIRCAAHSARISEVGHSPDLLGVGAEEELEQPPAEALRDPVLEGLGLGPRAQARGRVGGPAAGDLGRADLADDVAERAAGSRSAARASRSARGAGAGAARGRAARARGPRPRGLLVKKRWPPRSNR